MHDMQTLACDGYPVAFFCVAVDVPTKSLKYDDKIIRYYSHNGEMCIVTTAVDRKIWGWGSNQYKQIYFFNMNCLNVANIKEEQYKRERILILFRQGPSIQRTCKQG